MMRARPLSLKRIVWVKVNITKRVKLATISWGWTYSEGNREKRGIRVHEEPGWDPVELEGPEWLPGRRGGERGLRGGEQQSTLDPEQLARAPMRPGAGSS